MFNFYVANVRISGSVLGRSRIVSWILWYCSRWYSSASSRLFQKLNAKTRSGFPGETSTISSTKPRCFSGSGLLCIVPVTMAEDIDGIGKLLRFPRFAVDFHYACEHVLAPCL